jgi:transposase InsO family protein
VIRAEEGVSVQRFCERIGIPRSTYYYWRSGYLHGHPVRRWPSPVVDAIEQRAAECAQHYLAWGHRKICAMLRADGVSVSASSVARALKRRGLLLPARYLKERRQLAAARRAAFLVPPTRRNRVWQTDFTEFTTTAHGSWRICPVIDYATKTVLAAPVAGTMNGRDAVLSLKEAIGRAEALMGHSLLDDCLDRETGEIFPLIIVTDNGAAFRSLDFESFIASRPELTHVRTRNHAPETNGVVERFNRTIKYEHLYRLEIANGDELATCVEEFISLYNEVRPHEAIQDAVPMSRFLVVPAHLSSTESVQEG